MTTYAAHVPQQTTMSGNSSLPKTSTAIEELLFSESQRQLISQIVGTSFIPIIFLLGSAGNVITLAVLFRQGLRDTTNLVLSGLAFADLVYIASHSIPQISYFVYSLDEGLATAWRLGSTMALQHVSFASGRIAALLVCLIVTERYIVVAFPLHAPGIVTKLRMRLAFGFIYLATTVISLPFFLSSDIYYTYSTTYNRYMPTSWVTQFGKDTTEFLNLYKRIVLTIGLRIVPVAYVIALTASILWILRKSRLWRQTTSIATGMTSQESEQMRVTRTLISVCLVYTASTLPATIYIPCMYLVPGFNQHGEYKNILSVVYLLTSVVEMIHSSASFFLYISTSKKFSATFHEMFFSSKAKVSSGKESSSQITYVKK